MKRIDEEIEGVEINKYNKLKKLVYMDDLKIFVNEKENIERIDKLIISLYNMRRL